VGLHLDIRLPRSALSPGQLAAFESRADSLLLAGGFGSGKTTLGGVKSLQLKCENPDAPGLIVSQNYKSLWSITYPKFMEICRRALPPDQQPKVYDKNGACYLAFADGVPIYLRSAQNPMSIDGLDVGWLWGDELRHWKKKAYEIAIGRVRVKCPRSQKVFTSTPDMGFMADEFLHKKSPHRVLIRMPTSENAKHLEPGYIEKLRLSYSPRLQKVILDGFFAILEGAVYEQLDVDIWNSPWAANIDMETVHHTRISLCFDPGYRKSALGWISEQRPGKWVLFDEYMGENESDAALVDIINSKPWPIDEIWVDPAGDATQSTLALDTLDMLDAVVQRDGGDIRHVVAPFRGIAFGVDKLRTLYGNPEHGQPIRLQYDKRLEKVEESWTRGFVRDSLSYQYPEVKDGRPISNEPLKDGKTDHSMDALRMWAVGMVLTNPKLRNLDSRIDEMARGRSGWRSRKA
jgi:hypothetical protein